MSWTPDFYIGGPQPWPDSVRVVLDWTDETRRYVPERTCKDKAKSGPYFWCDSCNQFIIYPSPPNYCPECGAKVVDK